MKTLLLIRYHDSDASICITTRILQTFDDGVTEKDIGVAIEGQITTILQDVHDCCNEYDLEVTSCSSVESINQQVEDNDWTFTFHDGNSPIQQRWELTDDDEQEVLWGFALADSDGVCHFHI